MWIVSQQSCFFKEQGHVGYLFYIPYFAFFQEFQCIGSR